MKSMSDKQKRALAEGQIIRTIAGVDVQASRVFDADLRANIRSACDEQMHRIGRESLTEQRDRIRAMIERGDWPSQMDYRYRKLETKE